VFSAFSLNGNSEEPLVAGKSFENVVSAQFPTDVVEAVVTGNV
jgi:hypothetical protein